MAPVQAEKAGGSETGRTETLADLLDRLGRVPLHRVRAHPAPGSATEEHVLEARDGGKQLCELVDGTLVEKDVGFLESYLAGVLVRLLGQYADAHDLGIVLPPDGALRFAPRLVRMPDVSFISWRRLPGRKLPVSPIPDLIPDLAVEVLSKGNTGAEMERKLADYFQAGVRLVWYADPGSRTVRVYKGLAERPTVLTEADTLDGGDVLPGFSLSIREWFSAVPREESRGPE